MDIHEARELFPYLKTGRIYFNHASTGPLSIRVLNTLNAVMKNSSEGKIDDYLSFLKTSAETKQLLAAYLNTSPENIAFGDNTTNGINLLAQGIEWKKGDRVLLNDIEFPANVYPFLNLKQYGVEVDFVKSTNGIVTAEDIISNIKPETKLISVSQVQFLTGYRIDLGKLGSYCRDNGIIFSIDAIQGLGAFPINVEKCNVDFISSGTQKWLLGLQGMAFVYVSKSLQEKIHPKYTGWLSVQNAWDLLDFNTELKNTADRYQNGTLNTLGIYALKTSLDLFNEFGIDKIKERVTANSLALINGLQNIGINPILKNCSTDNLSGIVSFKIDNAQNIFDKLTERNISTALREGIIRLSPHFYNDKDEIDKVINTISELI